MIRIDGVVLAQAEEPEQIAPALDQELTAELEADLGVAEDDAGMPQLAVGDFAPQLVWLAITFVALYFLMSRVALPRIATVIESRRDRIANDLDTAARLRQETDEVIAAYEQELTEARNKAHRIAAEARDKLNAEFAEERARIEAELAEKTAAAEARIGESRDRALAEIDKVAAGAAADIVESLIGDKPSDKELDAALKSAEGA